MAAGFDKNLGKKGVWKSIALGVSLAALAVAVACQPLRPSGGKKPGSADANPESLGAVGFSFADDAFHLMTEPPATLRVRIFQVVNEQQGSQEGNDLSFPITEATHTYHLDGVKLGMKEFVLELLDARNEVVGEGHGRLLVKPGTQQFDAPIEITVRDPSRQRRDVNLSVFVQTSAPGETPKTTYLDTKQVIHDSCIGCHAATTPNGPAGGLVLDTFPFVAGEDLPTQDAIVGEMVKAMRAFTWQMPPDPSPRVPAEKIALIEKWANDGLPAVPAGSDDLTDLAASVVVKWQMADSVENGQMTIVRGADATNPFAAAWHGAVVDAKYNLTIEVHSRDGSIFATQAVAAPQLVGATGDLGVTITIPYTAPSVDIPIVIH